MTKNEVLKAVAEKTNVSKKDIEEILTAYADVVVETLTENHNEKVPVVGGIATFSVKHVAEKSGVAALAGGKPWTVPAHDEITVKMAKSKKTLA